MKRMIVGVAVGMLLGATLPQGAAHHGSDYRRLARRINALEDKTQRLDSNGYMSGDYVRAPFGCGNGDDATWDFSGLDCP